MKVSQLRQMMMMMILTSLLVSSVHAGGRRAPVQEFQEQPQTSDHTLPSHPEHIIYDSLNWKVPLGEPYRSELSGGLITYVAVDSTLPLITIHANIRSASLTDPQGKEGLGMLMSRLLRTGGTKAYNADTLDGLIDLLAMKFSFTQSESHIGFNATFLSEYLDTAFEIMEQMFFHPAFQPEKIIKEKSIVEESIRHRFVNPGPTLSAAYRKLMYPQSAPGRLTTRKSLNSITQKDLIALHKQVFTNNNIMVAASGKFDREDLLIRLNTIFSSSVNKEPVLLPEIKVNPGIQALIVHKPMTQTYVRIGLPLFKRPHPDFYAVSVLNLILGGGGFTSRLGTKVRSDEGLTYSIYSNSESNYTYPGTLFIDFYTKTESFPRATHLVLEELEKIRQEGVSELELENAKTNLISELPSMFRSPGDIVSTYAWSEFFGRPADHYAKYPETIRNLSRKDIHAVAQKYLDPTKLTYTIVGDTTALLREESGSLFSLDSLKSRKIVLTDSLTVLP